MKKTKCHVGKDVWKSELLHIAVKEENPCSQCRKWSGAFKKLKKRTIVQPSSVTTEDNNGAQNTTPHSS